MSVVPGKVDDNGQRQQLLYASYAVPPPSARNNGHHYTRRKDLRNHHYYDGGGYPRLSGSGYDYPDYGPSSLGYKSSVSSGSTGYNKEPECCPLVVDPLTFFTLLGFLAGATYFLNVLITMNIMPRRRRRESKEKSTAKGQVHQRGIAAIQFGETTKNAFMYAPTQSIVANLPRQMLTSGCGVIVDAFLPAPLSLSLSLSLPPSLPLSSSSVRGLAFFFFSGQQQAPPPPPPLVTHLNFTVVGHLLLH